MAFEGGCGPGCCGDDDAPIQLESGAPRLVGETATDSFGGRPASAFGGTRMLSMTQVTGWITPASFQPNSIPVFEGGTLNPTPQPMLPGGRDIRSIVSEDWIRVAIGLEFLYGDSAEFSGWQSSHHALMLPSAVWGGAGIPPLLLMAEDQSWFDHFTDCMWGDEIALMKALTVALGGQAAADAMAAAATDAAARAVASAAMKKAGKAAVKTVLKTLLKGSGWGLLFYAAWCIGWATGKSTSP